MKLKFLIPVTILLLSYTSLFGQETRSVVAAQWEYFSHRGPFLETGFSYGTILSDERQFIHDGPWFDVRLGHQDGIAGYQLQGSYFVSKVRGLDLTFHAFEIQIGPKILIPFSKHFGAFFDILIGYGHLNNPSGTFLLNTNGFVTTFDGGLLYKPLKWMGIGPYTAFTGNISGTFWFVSGLILNFTL